MGYTCGMANEQNIEPYRFTSAQDREKAARNGRKGGIASGKAKRQKKALRELVELMMQSVATGEAAEVAREFGGALDDEDMINAAAVVGGQIRAAAIDGNCNAAKWLADMLDGGADSRMEDDGLSKSLEELGKRL